MRIKEVFNIHFVLLPICEENDVLNLVKVEKEVTITPSNTKELDANNSDLWSVITQAVALLTKILLSVKPELETIILDNDHNPVQLLYAYLWKLNNFFDIIVYEKR